MNNVLEDSLFVSQNRKFDEIQSIVRQFSAEYVGNSIIKDNIFAVILRKWILWRDTDQGNESARLFFGACFQ